ncbi:hypothetical protein [Nocardioides acrostichi]|uniref:Uncharacterized protein n=1 Tax=Nocardioides acrostichi TaxID=2784339 RepID=A0A930YAI5_9ACTN|nr:hypothetical protein [Nocardioides acrostichi]MBF4161438.1 hypothetical protein [Nocardioides acrostichi]
MTSHRDATPLPLRLMAAATASYGAYALAQPAHLRRAIGSEDDVWDTVARVFGVRDLAVSTVTLAGPPGAARAAHGIRIALDLGDAAVLGSVLDGQARRKAVGVALAWGGLNALAWLASRR